MAKQVMKVFFLAFLAVASISQADLVAWYQLDDAFAACGDTVVNTLSGEQGAWGDGIISDRNAVGTILSYADSVQGVANKGLHLIDYSSAINSNHIAIDTGNKLTDGSTFTLMGWSKTPTASSTPWRIFMFGQFGGTTGTPAGNLYLSPADKLNDYKARLFLGTNCPALLSPQAYNDGKWHHVAATYDGSVARLYVDGVEVASASFTGIVFNPISNLVIGNLSQPLTEGNYISGFSIAFDYSGAEAPVPAGQTFEIVNPDTWQTAYTGNTVPEPATLALLAIGAIGFRKRK